MPQPTPDDPVAITGLWLRRAGGENDHGIEVLFERDGVWYSGIREDDRGQYSVILEPAGMLKCKPDSVTA